MRRRQHRVLQGLCGVFLAGACVSAWADVAKNPYDSIVDQNPFRLKPIPPPPDPTTNAPPPAIVPPAQVEVTGITTITGDKRALLEIIPGPGKPMIRPPPLGEGERVESVEVVSISVEKSEVTIKNGPVVTNLTFKVVKSPAPGAPGAPGVPVPGVTPGVHPAAPVHQAAVGAASPANYNNSGRGGVMVGGGAQPVAPAATAAAAAVGPTPANSVSTPPVFGGENNGNFRSIPSRNIRTTSPQGELGRAEQAVLIEANRMANQGIPGMAPLPPTMANPNPTPVQPPGANSQNPVYPNPGYQNPAYQNPKLNYPPIP